MAGWFALTMVLVLPRFFMGGRSGTGKDLLQATVALIRVFLVFAAWWGARVVIGWAAWSGFVYWATVAVLAMCVVAVLLKFLGDIASEDLSAARVVKEFACLCLGIVLLSMIGNGSLPLRHSPSGQQPNSGPTTTR
jgi:magnesium-transporting ATPase (P-type)